MKKKGKDTTLEEDIDARLKVLEGYQLSRAEIREEMLKQSDSIILAAIPKIKIRTAKDLASVVQANSTLMKDQRLCAGMETDKAKHEFSGPGGAPIILKVIHDFGDEGAA